MRESELGRQIRWGILLILTCASASLANEPSYRPSQPSSKTAETQSRVRVSITFTSRNGSNGLATALVTLAQLKERPNFSPFLSMPLSRLASTAHCENNAPGDASGRLFYLARCAGVWPDEGKAPEPKTVELAFTTLVASKGISAFPAVIVSTFEFQQRLQPAQIPSRIVPTKFVRSADGQLQPSTQLTKFLCDPQVTLIENCRVQVIDRLRTQQPDIFSSQRGYRMDLLNPMPQLLAQKLVMRIRRRIEWGLSPPNRKGSPEVPTAALSISIVPAPASSQQVKSALSQIPASFDAAKDFAAVWGTVEVVDPSSLELGATPPSLFLFDRMMANPLAPLPEAREFRNWYDELRTAWGHLAGSACKQAPDVAAWHADRAASLLFPKSVRSILTSLGVQSSSTALQTPAWSGLILDSAYLQGRIRVGTASSWFDPAAIHSTTEQPRIAVAVYTQQYGGPKDQRAADFFDSVLSVASNLLVVSAPQVSEANGVTSYGPDPVFTAIDRSTLKADCQAAPTWPSCLGKHPRVLVVAPSRTSGANKPPELLSPEDFVLGASTVRIAAPGNSIPVLSPCTNSVSGPTARLPSSNKGWQVVEDNGTSYAAPIVALVLARLIEVGTDRMKQVPEVAIWRVLATADRIPPRDPDDDPDKLVAFGQINAARALNGAFRSEIGENGQATIYPSRLAGGPAAAPRYAVVMPYPWNDALDNVTRDGGGPGNYVRGVLPYTVRYGKTVKTKDMDFRNVLRVVRRGKDQHGVDMFDIYYLKPVGDDGTEAVTVTTQPVYLGTSDPSDGSSSGYCRLDNIPQPATSGSVTGQPEPSCLYELVPDSNGKLAFRALDLTKTDEIVLPPLNFEVSRFVNDVDPTQLANVTAVGSPWRDAFCDTRPRNGVRPLLSPNKPEAIDALCKRTH